MNCKPKETVVKDYSVNDTIIKHEAKVIQLPTKSITIIEQPCKDSILTPIYQEIQTGEVKATIKNDQGNLVVEVNIDSIVSTKVKEILKHSEKQREVVTITETKIPKWMWYVLGILVAYVAYRILRLSIPFLRVLPY